MSKERRRRRGAPPAGRAIGWWIAGFEERIYPQRETVEERVRWGTETRAASGEGSGVVVRFPGGSADHGDPEAEGEAGGPAAADADGAEGPAADAHGAEGPAADAHGAEGPAADPCEQGDMDVDGAPVA